jgi:hypothetical protein
MVAQKIQEATEEEEALTPEAEQDNSFKNLHAKTK